MKWAEAERSTIEVVIDRETSSHRIPPWILLSFVGALGVLAYATRLALFVAPTEETMGNIQRIFYYHVPSNILAEIFPYINFVASGIYLFYRTRNPERAMKADALALASAEMTVLFSSIGLASGMLWGKPVWGIWWTWDARLTSFFVLWLLYVSYLVLRKFSSSGQTQTLAAILSVFAAVDVPIVFMSIRWWRTQHPAPVFGSDGSLDPAFWPAFLWNCLGWTMWGALVCTVRYALERRRQENEQATAFAALDEDVEFAGRV
jgi:heme exporter protein C